MSAAGVLQSFSPSAMPGPVMPMDVAMRFYISHSPPPLRSFLSSYEGLQRAKRQSQNHRNPQRFYKPLRPCLSSHQKAPDDRGCREWNNTKASTTNKKRVVFADSKGMSLTAIHIFSKFDDEPRRNLPCRGVSEELQFDMSDLESATMDLKISSARSLALDFKQPSADYLDFRNRLIKNSVCLESCSLQERSLTGTIKVRNVGFEKSVQIRTTFDSWASYTNVNCTFMNNIYSCQDTDTFAFVLELPTDVLLHHGVEFCICFMAQGQTYWDNNDGKNYKLKHAGWSGEDLSSLTQPMAAIDERKTCEQKNGGMRLLEMETDQFGSPRMSSGLFPGWQSWSQSGDSVPYW